MCFANLINLFDLKSDDLAAIIYAG